MGQSICLKSGVQYLDQFWIATNLAVRVVADQKMQSLGLHQPLHNHQHQTGSCPVLGHLLQVH